MFNELLDERFDKSYIRYYNAIYVHGDSLKQIIKSRSFKEISHVSQHSEKKNGSRNL